MVHLWYSFASNKRVLFTIRFWILRTEYLWCFETSKHWLRSNFNDLTYCTLHGHKVYIRTVSSPLSKQPTNSQLFVWTKLQVIFSSKAHKVPQIHQYATTGPTPCHHDSVSNLSREYHMHSKRFFAQDLIKVPSNRTWSSGQERYLFIIFQHF